MTLPIKPPLKPMLAKLQPSVPRAPGWVYEPKWDGFRAIVFRDGSDIHVASRDHKPLERYFPELPSALDSALPQKCVVDGEVIVVGDHGLAFDSLTQRIHPARSRVEKLAAETPASFFAFDLLALDDDDLMSAPLEQRRSALADFLDGPVEPELPSRGLTEILLTPQTDDADVASSWIDEYEDVGVDGVVAKRLDSIYQPGDRVMVKVKLQRTADCVVGGYRLSKSGDGIGSLLLGLYDSAGVLHYVGHTSGFRAAERPKLLEELRPLEGGHSFGGGRAPGGPSRWASGRNTDWVPLEPKRVCEVSFDRMMSGRFRHAVGFVRWRDDRDPKSCTFDQITGAAAV
jgi:ATP-dependent DNA ligase